MIWPFCYPRRKFVKFLTILLYRTFLLNTTKMLIRILKLYRTIIFPQCFNNLFPINQCTLTIYPREEIKNITFQIYRCGIKFVFLWSLIVAEIFLCFQNPSPESPTFESRKFHLCVWPPRRTFWPHLVINVFFFFSPNILFSNTSVVKGIPFLGATVLGFQCSHFGWQQTNNI